MKKARLRRMKTLKNKSHCNQSRTGVSVILMQEVLDG